MSSLARRSPFDHELMQKSCRILVMLPQLANCSSQRLKSQRLEAPCFSGIYRKEDFPTSMEDDERRACILGLGLGSGLSVYSSALVDKAEINDKS